MVLRRSLLGNGTRYARGELYGGLAVGKCE